MFDVTTTTPPMYVSSQPDARFTHVYIYLIGSLPHYYGFNYILLFILLKAKSLTHHIMWIIHGIERSAPYQFILTVASSTYIQGCGQVHAYLNRAWKIECTTQSLIQRFIHESPENTKTFRCAIPCKHICNRYL